jgi:uncharacterized membrane protein YuzA (DUF378 family)
MNRLTYLAQQTLDPNKIPHPKADAGTLAHFLTILFTIIGALAFLMLVISGFRLVISSGEPQKVAEIRRQIIYIVVGLILAASADIIVTFVVNKAG